VYYPQCSPLMPRSRSHALYRRSHLRGRRPQAGSAAALHGTPTRSHHHPVGGPMGRGNLRPLRLEGQRRGGRADCHRPRTRLPASTGGAMTFADLVAGDAVFVDANTLTYHFQPHPTWGPPCTDLLRRIENQELFGFTSTHVLSEVSHRLMTIQASALLGWPFAGIGNRLRTNPAEGQKLTALRQAIDQVLHSKFPLFTIPPPSPA